MLRFRWGMPEPQNETAIKEFRRFGYVYYQRGQIRDLRCENAAALGDYERAIEFNPTFIFERRDALKQRMRVP